jgi:hypothetical protein
VYGPLSHIGYAHQVLLKTCQHLSSAGCKYRQVLAAVTITLRRPFLNCHVPAPSLPNLTARYDTAHRHHAMANLPTSLVRDIKALKDSIDTRPIGDETFLQYSRLLQKYTTYRREVISLLRDNDLNIIQAARLKELRSSPNNFAAFNALAGTKTSRKQWEGFHWSELDIAFGDDWVHHKTFLVQFRKFRDDKHLTFRDSVEKVTAAKQKAGVRVFRVQDVTAALQLTDRHAQSEEEAQVRQLEG